MSTLKYPTVVGKLVWGYFYWSLFKRIHCIIEIVLLHNWPISKNARLSGINICQRCELNTLVICTNFDPRLSCCLSTKGSSIDHTKLVQWTLRCCDYWQQNRQIAIIDVQAWPVNTFGFNDGMYTSQNLWCLECSIPAFDLCTETCNFTPHCLSVGARKIIIVSLLLIMTSILLIASLVTWKKNTAFFKACVYRLQKNFRA